MCEELYNNIEFERKKTKTMMNLRKQLRQAQKLAKRQTDMHGEGRYLFQNNTSGEYQLSRPTSTNVRNLPKDGQFIGDSYYMSFVKSGELKLIKNLLAEETVPLVVEQLYVFRNTSRIELPLPSPSKDGQTVIRGYGNFVGGTEFFPMLKTGELIIVNEVKAMGEKLLTEQPPLVTNDGQVEFVVRDEDNITEEEVKNKKKKKLNENPLEGVKLLLD